MTKLDRQSYDLIKDAFQYYEFKMTTDQRDLAETILEIAFVGMSSLSSANKTNNILSKNF